MWAITLFLKDTTKFFEFKTEKEAKEYFKKLEGYKILSEIVYSNDTCSTKTDNRLGKELN
jgi:hypothetical protein